MKFLITQLIIFFSSVTTLWLLFSKEYFTPRNIDGSVNWYTITIFLAVLFMTLLSLGSVASTLFKKKFAYGRKEFPPFGPSLIQGILFAVIVIILLLLHIFHILSFGWGAFLVIIFIVITILIK